MAARSLGETAALVLLFCAAVSVFTLTSVTEAAHTGLKLDNNVYTGFLIAIHKDVPENNTIITNIKEYITNMSVALYTATRRRAYLGTTTILIPSTWSSAPNYEPATTELYEQAHVRIRAKNYSEGQSATWDDVPYTDIEDSKCKKPGNFIHLTPKYVLDQSFAGEIVGDIGKTLVHEFGHFRWSLRDEFPNEDQKSPCNYSDTPILSCAPDLKFTRQENSTHLGLAECTILPDVIDTSENASLMFLPSHPKVTEFCDHDTHMRDMENDMNDACEKSAWEVMSETEDFRGNRNAPTGSYTAPSFRFVRVMPVRNMIAIDGSASIDGKLEVIQTQLRNYITTTAPNNSFLGLVEFTYSWKTRVTHPLIKLDGDPARESIAQALPTEFKGSTCIKCGVQKAVEELERVGSAAGAIVTVFSDGKQNVRDVTELIPDLRSKRVVVDSVMYGKDYEEHLLKVSNDTGGHVRVVETSEDLHLALSDLMKIRAEDIKDFPIQATSSGVNVKPRQTVEGLVDVDESISEFTVFTFSWKRENVPVDVTLFTPDGAAAVTADSPRVRRTSLSVTITFAEAKVGQWKYKFRNNDTDPVYMRVSVQGRNPDTKTPVLLRSTVESSNINLTTEKALTIYATLSRGGYPVIQCDVRAEVKTASDSHTVKLLDNGARPDARRDDGIYSGHFLNFTADRYYSVTAHAHFSNTSCQTKIVSGSFGLRSSVKRYYELKKTERYEPVTSGSRVTSAGYFSVSGSANYKMDSLPPEKVGDLKISNIESEKGTATLTWTAVGSNLNEGTASTFEIRSSKNFTKLRKSFHETEKVRFDQSAASRPQPAGSLQKINIRIELPGYWGIAVVTIDEEDNRGPVSNIVYFDVMVSSGVYTNATTAHAETSSIHTIITDSTTKSLNNSRTNPPPASVMTSSVPPAGTTESKQTVYTMTSSKSVTVSTARVDTGTSVPTKTTTPNPISSVQIVGIAIGACALVVIVAAVIVCVTVYKVKAKAKVRHDGVSGSRVEFVNVGEYASRSGSCASFENPSYEKMAYQTNGLNNEAIYNEIDEKSFRQEGYIWSKGRPPKVDNEYSYITSPADTLAGYR